MSEKKPGLVERGANFFEKLHYGIGAVALAAAAVISSEFLAVVGALELAHGLVINGLKNWLKRGVKTPSSAALANS